MAPSDRNEMTQYDEIVASSASREPHITDGGAYDDSSILVGAMMTHTKRCSTV
ncbi:MAG: hypothetical protein VYD39_01445 [Bacteroidota bacterium]|nr:hypothetical protein [Bacteroidota bacterium]